MANQHFANLDDVCKHLWLAGAVVTSARSVAPVPCRARLA